ncbi:putative methyltransferase-domain-containing protein [Trametes maxima]|nr:putative methyltransferase-domain-containing protein [Trametes maxima]
MAELKTWVSVKHIMSDTGDILPALRGVVRIPAGSTRVIDADEEVFLLYTDLAARKAADGTAEFRGLGHIDSHEDTLTITLNLGVPDNAVDSGASGKSTRAGRAASHKKRLRGKRDVPERTLEVEIAQDKTALHSRKGDTGSVLWHASVDFAEVVLQQLHRKDPVSLLVPDLLSGAHVVELGAGTGLLAVVLAPFVRHYTVTDIEELVPLIRKNVSRSRPQPPASPSKGKAPLPSPALNVTVAALDWEEIRMAAPSLKRKLVPEEAADLLVVVDCIYHPSLIPPLLSTIDYLTVPGKTTVLVVIELRAEDVVREFLQGWLCLSPAIEWEIWSVSGLVVGPYAIWVGWKCAISEM